MRYTTRNPVEPNGSSDPRDLHDNAGNLDLHVNGNAPTWADRRGVLRRSLFGQDAMFTARQVEREAWFAASQTEWAARFAAFLARSGFRYIGDYDAGPLTITELGQVFEKDGELWGPAASLALPYTTLNNWPVDVPKFVARGDAVLRQELGSEIGTDLVSRNDETLSAVLDRSADQLAALGSNDSENQVIDLHYSISRGVGFIVGEIGETHEATILSVTGARELGLNSASGFTAGQLIVYTGSDGEHYTSAIAGIAGNAVTLTNDIEPKVVGSLFSNFYREQSHPNVNGYRAIADGALRLMSLKYKSAWLWQADDYYTVLGGASAGPFALSSYQNPGGSGFPSLAVLCPSITDGIVTNGVPLPAGDYVAKVWITPNLSNAAGLNILISENGGLGAINFVAAHGFRPMLIELPFRARNGWQYSVAFRATHPSAEFAISRIEFVKTCATTGSLNKGTHVLLGDSWFSLPGVAERLRARLPKATIINKGMGGHTAEQCWKRFDDDVTPYKPNFVWVMVGTNDVAQGVLPTNFYMHVGIISYMIKRIGAAGIFFNSSVGPVAHTTLGDLLARSRNYAVADDYIGEQPGSLSSTQTGRFPIRITIPAGARRRVLMLPGITKKRVILNTLYLLGSAGETTGTITAGFCEGVNLPIFEPYPPLLPVSFPMQATLKYNTELPRNAALGKFCAIDIENTGIAPMEVGGYIVASWSPSQ